MLNLWHGLDAAIPELREADRVGMNGPISFDTSIKQFVQLLSGHTIVIIPEETRIDPAGLATHLNREEIEVVDFTPSHLELVLDGAYHWEQRSPALILLGGEAPREQLCKRLKNNRVYNLYGLTECAVDSLVGPVDTQLSPGTLGPPLINVEALAVDALWNPMPDGLCGELMISGTGLARGYFRSPARTAERFIPNPLVKTCSRTFRTGDLVERSTAGFFQYRGRSGSQVKIRGHRVSLSEIQSMMEAQPGVAAAVISSHKLARDSEQLVGWVVATLPYSPVVNGYSRYTVNGLSVAGLNQHEVAFLYGEVFERNAYLRNGLFLPEGACVFDVGANCGLFSLRTHLSSPGVRIFAFEPNPEVYQCLMANMEIFGISGHLLPMALGSQCGSAKFTSYSGFSLLSGFHADQESDLAVVREYIRQQQPKKAGEDKELIEELLAERFETHCYQREVTTISNVIRKFQIAKIDLLKINVEKSEAEVLEGIEPDDWEKIQQVVMEVHDTDQRLEQINTLLNSKGFKTVIEKDWSLPGFDSINYYIYATRYPERESAVVPAPSVDHLPTPLTEQGLRRALAAKLPEYKIPARIMVLDRMPLNDHGKVNQAALDKVLMETFASTQQAVPRTPLEAQLLQDWQEILERRDIGIETHFFEAGGDSFSIMQLNLRLRRQLGLDLPVVDMFRHPNIRLLAQHLNNLQQKTH
jgi:FkbM family methyltransferase